MLLASSCNGSGIPFTDTTFPDKSGNAIVDSTSLHLSFLTDSGISSSVPHSLDIFIYSSGLLEQHRRYSGFPSEIDLTVTALGVKTVVGIADFPFSFKLSALEKLESLSLMDFSLEDENYLHPLMSARREGEGELVLSPLLSCIRFVSISSALDGYELLENPKVWLSGINTSCGILQESGFRPTEDVEDTDDDRKIALPSDIGLFTQYPDIRLFSYPNDASDDLLGCIRTRINFSCRIRGEECHFSSVLPPFSRNTSLDAELTVFSETECLWKITQAR